MNKTILLALVGALALSVPTAAFANDSDKKPAAKRKVDKNSIYHRIGGDPAISAAVDLFYKKVLADKKVNHFFEDVNMDKQHRKQKAFLSAALGGPEPWTGKDMRKAHKHLDLTEADFNAIAGHLVATLQELGVKQKLIDEVIAVVATTKNDVLNKPKAKAGK